MTAGYNLLVDVWDIGNLADDDHGGAVVTGTYLGSLSARLQELELEFEPLLLQQGYETTRIITFITQYPTFTIQQNFELEICWPRDHPFFGERFRIGQFRTSSMSPRDRRRHLIIPTTRSERSHANQ